MEHTPGPWHASEGGVQVGKLEYLPATGRGNCGTPISEWRANAHLIAAAPDMLAALKAVVESEEGKPTSWRYRREELAEIARAAIGKAEGRS